jgi:transposase, IS5 family
MNSFFDIGLSDHLGSNNQLLKLDKLLDWNKFSSILSDVHSLDGPTGYPVLKMFKCLLLASWHSLSDPALEQSLRVRLDFMQFTGFSLGSSLPDETTFCRFRNKLIEKNKFDDLFNEVNRQLTKLNLKLESAKTAIVDATLISSNARPRKVMEKEGSVSYKTEYSKDRDARWLKKGKKHHFGYQGFARCDEEGFIDKTHVTPANMPETKELEVMAEGLSEGVRLQADKGFFSSDNKEMLKSKNLKNGLMYRAFRNKPLTKRNILFNKIISKKRWRIEQSFGTMKRRFCYQKASYFSTIKVDAEFKLKAMCLNLLKAINKVQFA